MEIETKNFGVIEIDEKSIIDFNEGIPGFPQIRKCVIISGKESESPFKWLQSVDYPEVSFVIIDPYFVVSDYEIEIKDDILESLGIKAPEDIMIYSIVVVPAGDVSKTRMNLRAPLVINASNNKGMQVVLETDKYSMRHYLFDEAQGQEVAAHAGSDKEKRTVDCNK